MITNGMLTLGHGGAHAATATVSAATLVLLGAAAILTLAVLVRLPMGGHRGHPVSGRHAVLAALSAAAGLIHAVVVPEHLGEHTVYGATFLALAVVQLAFAWWLLRPTPSVLRAAVWLNCTVAALWLWSRTTGLPFGPGAFEAGSVGMLDGACTVAQVWLAAGCLPILRSLPAVPSLPGAAGTAA
jgi:hypothetical protein